MLQRRLLAGCKFLSFTKRLIMLEAIKKIFGMGPKPNYSELVKNGALIIDVRSPDEFAQGHVKGAKNIPLERLTGQLQNLKDKDQPIITCCASGMRSASAKGVLKSNGYTQIYNGGGWQKLDSRL